MKRIPLTADELRAFGGGMTEIIVVDELGFRVSPRKEEPPVGSHVAPVLMEFFRALPPAGSVLTEAERANLNRTLADLIEFVYGSPPGDASQSEPRGDSSEVAS